MESIKFLKRNIDITKFSNFKTKATAKYFYELEKEEDLDKLSIIYNFCHKNNLKLLFIGGGTNLLFAFDIFEGVIIKNSLKGWDYNIESKKIESYSNEIISNIAQDLEKKYNQKLWNRFIGLPGTVGGAVFGNAGSFGLEAENNFIEAKIFDLKEGKLISLNKLEMDFSYRNSFIKKNMGQYFIIKVQFDLSTKIEKYHSIVDNINFRENLQPKGNTCGSFFKNPNKDNSAGKLIEDVGLKGYKTGGAFFSELHGNFLINEGGTYKDLLYLINLAQKKVKDKFGINLEPEVRIINN